MFAGKKEAMIRKISLYIQVIALIVMFLALLLLDKPYSLYAIYIFLIIWSADKVRAWHMKEDFGIHAQVSIPADAPKAVRLLGALFAIFVLYIGLAGLIAQVST